MITGYTDLNDFRSGNGLRGNHRSFFRVYVAWFRQCIKSATHFVIREFQQIIPITPITISDTSPDAFTHASYGYRVLLSEASERYTETLSTSTACLRWILSHVAPIDEYLVSRWHFQNYWNWSGPGVSNTRPAPQWDAWPAGNRLRARTRSHVSSAWNSTRHNDLISPIHFRLKLGYALIKYSPTLYYSVSICFVFCFDFCFPSFVTLKPPYAPI